MDRVLQACGLSRSFGQRRALDGVSLSVRPGVVTGLLGPNGAGKTTLMRVLLGILSRRAAPWSSMATPVDSRDRQRWGYMPQERGLYLAMPAGDQPVYLARLHGLSRADASRGAQGLLAEVGLEDRWAERTDRLSGAMQQRLHLARALVHDPEVIVLDEPLAAWTRSLWGTSRRRCAAGCRKGGPWCSPAISSTSCRTCARRSS